MEHPAHEELVLLQSGELDPSRVALVHAHLSVCADCTNRYNRLARLYSLVATSAAQPRRTGVGIAGRIVAAAMSAVVAIYLLTTGTASARADELLSRATAEEVKGLRPKFLRIRTGGLSCHWVTEFGRTLESARQDECDAISTAIGEAGWKASDLLSPQRFQQWRRGLSHKKESVKQSGGEVLVTTETDEGRLHLASLRVRTADYRPVSGHYEFAGSEAADRRIVEVVESDTLPVPSPEPERSEDSPPPPVSTTAIPPADPIAAVDRREARVRLILHEAGADGNALLAVSRDLSRVRVWGVVPDERTRQALVRRLDKLDGVTVELASESEQQDTERSTPWNPEHGNAPPLAQKQIDAMFPNQPEARQEYLNGIDHLAREVAGIARDREAVRALLQRVRASSEAPRLAGVTADLDRRIEDRLGLLRRQLSPLLQTGPNVPPASLSGEEGVELYNLVQRVAILSVDRDPLPLDDTLNRIAALTERR